MFPTNSQLLALILLPTLIWALLLVIWRILRGVPEAQRPLNSHWLIRFVDRLAILRRQEDISYKEQKAMGIISILVALITFIATAKMIILLISGRIPEDIFRVITPVMHIPLYVDALSLFFILVINIIALAASWNAFGYLKDELTANRTVGLYRGPLFFHVLMNLFHFTMLLAPVMDNLIGLWIAIESTTLVSALLVAFPNTERSWEAAWKYLLITSTGIILAFMGTVFLIHGANAAGLPPASMNWSTIMQHTAELQGMKHFVLLAFFFALAGYGVKAGLAPLHTWLPDAHGEAAPPVSALFSGVLLKAAFYAILRFVILTDAVLGAEKKWLISYTLMSAGLFSLVMAVPFILNRKNHFKRVLAYHSLEHMGIILFGTGIGGAVALFGALFHVLNHAITKALMFLAYGNVLRKIPLPDNDETGSRSEPTGVLYLMPFTGLLLALGGLALVGTPPFNIFLSQWMILWGSISLWQTSAISSPLGYPLDPILLGLAILTFIIATMFIYFGLVQHLAHILLDDSTKQRATNSDQRAASQSPSTESPDNHHRKLEPRYDLIPLWILMSLALILGISVLPPLAQLIQKSVEIFSAY